MGTNSELKKIEAELQVFMRNIDESLNKFAYLFKDLFEKYNDINNRIKLLEDKDVNC